jgi:hypothetical protein
MNTTQTPNPRNAKFAFMINGFLGILMLVTSALLLAFGVSEVRESFGLLVGAIACLFACSINYAKYLSLAG